jgi:hypothetical protein
VWAGRVVLIAPLLDDDLSFLEAVKDLLVEAFVAQLAVEGFAIAVLPRTAWLDVERFGPQPGEPAADHFGGHLCAVVRTDVLGDASGEHHIGQCFDDAEAVDATSNPDGQAFAGVFIDQGHQPEPTAIMSLGFDKVVAPDMIAMLWPEPDTGSVIEPEPASRFVFPRYFQPLTAPDPLHAITANLPTRLDQKRGDPAIAITPIPGSQSDDRAGQCILVSSGNGRVALRAAGLVDDPAGVAFGEPILLLDPLDCPPAPFGAYKFPDATSFRICFSSDRSATSRFRRTFSRSKSFIRLA